MNLGLCVREKREAFNMSQTQLAKKINRSPQLICDIEAGRRNPGRETLLLLAKQLNMSLDKIFCPSITHKE